MFIEYQEHVSMKNMYEWNAKCKKKIIIDLLEVDSYRNYLLFCSFAQIAFSLFLWILIPRCVSLRKFEGM